MWLGHSAFRLDTPEGNRIYIDPWLASPQCPSGERSPSRVDLVVVTHGHPDHVGDTQALYDRHRPAVIAPQDLRRRLERDGLEPSEALGPDKGGTAYAADVAVTMTDARHSSGGPDYTYGGDPCGCVVKLSDGVTIYFAGDTCVFLDMALIAELYPLDLAVVPIGGLYTMDPRQAAKALELLKVDRCVPCHYLRGDPLLRGTPEELRALAGTVEVLAPEPGVAVALVKR